MTPANTSRFKDEVWIHDASVRWDSREDYSVTFGVHNLTDEKPCLASVAPPVSGLGRSFFLRITGSY